MIKTSSETLINKLLKEQDLLLAADALLKKWNQDELSREEKSWVGLFLVNSGLHSTLKNQILQDLTQNREMVWPAICALLSKYPESFKEDFVNPIMLGFLESDRLHEILELGEFIKLHPRFQSTYDKLIAEKSKDSGINYLQLKNILSRKEIENLFVEKKQSDPENKEKQKTISSYLANAKKFPNVAYDLAISLAQSEEFEMALQCLEHAPSSKNKDWLRLELLLEAKKYLKALEESYEVEQKYSHEADTLVETLICRARAYEGLNDKNTAIQLLRVILDTLPKNQKAKVLLEKMEEN